MARSDRAWLRLLIRDIGGEPEGDLLRQDGRLLHQFRYEGLPMLLWVVRGDAWGVTAWVDAPDPAGALLRLARLGSPAVAASLNGGALELTAMSFNHHHRVRAADVSMAAEAVREAVETVMKGGGQDVPHRSAQR